MTASISAQTALGSPEGPSLPDVGHQAVERLNRADRRRRRLVTLSRLALLVGFLVAWQVFSGPRGDRIAVIDEYYVSEPSQVLRAIRAWWDQGVLVRHLWATVQVTLIGFLIGTVSGLAVGLLLGIRRFLADVFNPAIAALYAVPRLALTPLLILWFGLGMESKVALVTIVTFFLVFYNTYSGVKEVPADLIDVLRVMGARWWQIHRKVTLPSAMTWIIAGLRISVPYALVAAVTGEMLASNLGMGYLITRSAGQFFTAGVFGAIVILVLLSLALTAGVTLVERAFLKGKPGAAGRSIT